MCCWSDCYACGQDATSPFPAGIHPADDAVIYFFGAASRPTTLRSMSWTSTAMPSLTNASPPHSTVSRYTRFNLWVMPGGGFHLLSLFWSFYVYASQDMAMPVETSWWRVRSGSILYRACHWHPPTLCLWICFIVMHRDVLFCYPNCSILDFWLSFEIFEFWIWILVGPASLFWVLDFGFQYQSFYGLPVIPPWGCTETGLVCGWAFQWVAFGLSFEFTEFPARHATAVLYPS